MPVDETLTGNCEPLMGKRKPSLGCIGPETCTHDLCDLMELLIVPGGVVEERRALRESLANL
jgi:hypothetical protein